MKITAMFLTVLLLGLGCSKSSDNPVSTVDDTSNQILPLQVGNSWTYNVMTYDTAGIGTFYALINMVVVRDTTIGGERWYIVSSSGSSGVGIIKVKSDGLWYHSAAGNFLGVKYPAADLSAFLLQSITVSVASNSASVTVPKGTFSCIKYGVTQGTSFFGPGPTDYYFSKGKGLVQINVYLTSGGKTTRYMSVDLMDYVVQ
ncbi:MAG: hypothetical protein WBD36_10955 [Bacteroidota bacterium]